MNGFIIGPEIRVWVVGNNIDIPYSQMIRYISFEERTKASSFIFEKDKIHFIKTRFFIRLAISHYLNLELKDVNFVYNKYAKPSVDPAISNIPINFSISHSNALIVFALQMHQDIGVDIEYIEDNKINELLYNEDILSVEEIELIKSERTNCRSKLFYKLWTCKESYLKALGVGLNVSLQNVSIDPSLKEATVICNNTNHDLTTTSNAQYQKCSLINLQHLPRGYVGTIASFNTNLKDIKYVDQKSIQNILDRTLCYYKNYA